MKKKIRKSSTARRRSAIRDLTKLQKELKLLAQRSQEAESGRRPVDYRSLLRAARRAMLAALRGSESKLLRAGSIAKAVTFIVKMIKEIHTHF